VELSTGTVTDNLDIFIMLTPVMGPTKYSMRLEIGKTLNTILGPGLAIYCNSLIDAGISRIPSAGSFPTRRPRYHGSIKEHYQLLEHGRTAISRMAKNPCVQNAAVPVILHPDLHKETFSSQRKILLLSQLSLTGNRLALNQLSGT
jgi:hypothetical protein